MVCDSSFCRALVMSYCEFLCCLIDLCLFFFNDTATTDIYTYLHTLSLHDALPISCCPLSKVWNSGMIAPKDGGLSLIAKRLWPIPEGRSASLSLSETGY